MVTCFTMRTLFCVSERQVKVTNVRDNVVCRQRRRRARTQLAHTPLQHPLHRDSDTGSCFIRSITLLSKLFDKILVPNERKCPTFAENLRLRGKQEIFGFRHVLHQLLITSLIDRNFTLA